MSGYYPATFGFENDEVDTVPMQWIDGSGSNSHTKVISGIDGHNKVLECYSSSSDRCVSNIFYDYQETGAIDFWWYKSSSYPSAAILDFYGETPGTTISIRVDHHPTENQDKVEYQTASGYLDTGYPYYQDNKWMHFRIEFDCSTDTYSLWIDQVKYLNHMDFLNSIDQTKINLTRFVSYGSGNQVLYYIDALGFSWDPKYYLGDNLYEGLLLSFENDTTHEWMGYSLDSATNVTILGNTTIPMPANGSHSIQVFANDTFGIIHESSKQYFTIDFPINIVTPKAKIYAKSSEGYYPATYGFENNLEGNFPDEWVEGGNGDDYLDKTTIESTYIGHNKVMCMNDTHGSSRTTARQDFEIGQSSGTVELWTYFESDSGENTDIRVENDTGALLATIGARDNIWKFSNGTGPGTSEEVSTGLNAVNDWFHLRVDFSNDGGYNGLFEKTYNFSIRKSDGSLYYSSPIINFTNFYGGSAGRFSLTSWHGAVRKTWLDAIGYSWELGYNIGNNLEEGLLLSFENETTLDWMGYSIDGKTNNTIFGNTTIPMPDYGYHLIKVYANDTIGNINHSNVRRFYCSPIDILTPENRTYTEPMNGYYPGIYGFENDETGSIPKNWAEYSGTGCSVSVSSEIDGHKKVLRFADPINGEQAHCNQSLSSPQSFGTIEFWIYSTDITKRWLAYTGNDTAWGYFALQMGPSAWQFDTIGAGGFATISGLPSPQVNTWHHVRWDFECTDGGYSGLSQYKMRVTVDGTASGPLDFSYAVSNTTRLALRTSAGDDNYDVYIDALSYSWDPMYNIGDNRYKGLLLSFENKINLNWTYSLDGGIENSIMGNTTLSFPNNGSHSIQVFGSDEFGNHFHSEKILFHIKEILSPIAINDTDQSKDWKYHQFKYRWCTGSGTFGDPYTLENLTIDGQNSAFCIEILNSTKYFRIKNCIIYNSTTRGIYFYYVNNGTIFNNNISNNDGDGIYLLNSDNNTISENTVNNNDQIGINFWKCFNNTVSGNNLSKNNNEGIYLSECDDHTISGNNVHNSTYAHGIYLYDNCNNNTISGNNAYNNTLIGIYLRECYDSNVSGNIAIYNKNDGIMLGDCFYSIVSGNTANNNTNNGIRLYYSDNNSVFGNTVNYNNDGISVEISRRNNISENNIANNNLVGAKLDTSSSNNTFYNNTFINQPIHADDAGSDNRWNSSIIGNYWDNYTNLGSSAKDANDDGIGDIPYPVGGTYDYKPIFDDGPDFPLIQVNDPINNTKWSSPPTINLTVYDDDLEYIWYTVSGNPTKEYLENNTAEYLNDTLWSGLNQGSFDINFYANDSVGNLNDSLSYILYKDTSAPNIIIITPLSGSYWNTIPSINVSVSDLDLESIWYSNGTVNIALENEIVQDLDDSIWEHLSEESEFKLYIYADDNYENLASITLTLYKDIKPPDITIFTPENNEDASDSPPEFDVNVTDNYFDYLWFSLENESGFPISYSWEGNISDFNISQQQWDMVGDGVITIKFYARDKAGNIGFSQVIVRKNIEYWPLSPFVIDELGNGNYTWEESVDEGWCEGSGTLTDPYIIDFISINGQNSSTCLEIRNSDTHFIVRNCKFYNGSFDINEAGIKLINTYNGIITDCNCSYNNYFGIYLESSNENEITSNTANHNRYAGIGLYFSDNNTISNNKNTINSNDVYGIYLNNSHYNNILGNIIERNSIGIYLDASDKNTISGNILNENEQGIVILDNCRDNVLGVNQVSSDVFLTMFWIILISITVGMVSTGFVVVKRHMIVNYFKPKEKEVSKKADKLTEKVRVKRERLMLTTEEQFDQSAELFEKPKKRRVIRKKEKPRKIVEKVVPKKPIKTKAEEPSKYVMTHAEMEELRKTEAEVSVEEPKILCIVHKGTIDGTVYICPSCKSYYCMRCASVLIDREEKCWACDSEIMLKKPELEQIEEIQKEKVRISDQHVVFLSYSTLDSNDYNIPEISNRLEKYPEINQVFYWESDSGESVVEFMEEMLKISDIFVLICTDNSMKSVAVRDEWMAAFQLRKRGEMKLIPVYEDEKIIPRLLLPLLNVKYTRDDFDGFIEKLYKEITRKEHDYSNNMD